MIKNHLNQLFALLAYQLRSRQREGNVIKLISIFRDAKTPIDTMFFTRKIKIRRGATLPPNVHAFFGVFFSSKFGRLALGYLRPNGAKYL
jgi:hypothetical protein